MIINFKNNNKRMESAILNVINYLVPIKDDNDEDTFCKGRVSEESSATRLFLLNSYGYPLESVRYIFNYKLNYSFR